MLDALSVRLCEAYYKQRLEAPNTFEGLIRYATRVDHSHLALRFTGQEYDQMPSTKPFQNVNVSEIRSKIFDEKLGGVCSGGAHRVHFLAMKLFDVENILLYSTPSIVYLLRNLRLSMRDILFPKRYLYRFARELGASKSDFRVESLRQSVRVSQGWPEILESTQFGIDFKEETADLAKRVGLTLNSTDVRRVQKRVGILWIGKVHHKSRQTDVAPTWPIFTKKQI